MKKTMQSFAAVLLCLAACLAVTGCRAAGTPTEPSGIPTVSWTASATPVPTPAATTAVPTVTPLPTPIPTPTPPPQAEAVIYGAGDVLLHDTFFNYPPDAEGHYDYSECFTFLDGILDDGYAVADYEGTLGGGAFSGFPRFSGPDDIVPALWNAGFRMMTTANNHTIDTGLEGVQRTAKVFRDFGFETIGTRPDTASESFSIVEVNGIRIGFAGFTFETPGTDAEYAEGIRALNAIPMPDGAAELIDSFNPYRTDLYERDRQEMFARAALLREHGAEAVVFFIHWGEDYSWTDDLDPAAYAHLETTRLVPSPYVEELARDLADCGVDVIVGDHPHLVHGIGVIESAVTGRSTLVYYSTGNMLSGMDGSVHNARYRDGILARVTIRRDSLGVTTVASGEYIPIYCNRWLTGERRHYQVVPVRRGLVDPESFNATGAQLENSLSNTLSVLSGCTGTESLPVSEAQP